MNILSSPLIAMAAMLTSRMIRTIKSQVNEICALFDSAPAQSELEKSGIRIISGIARRARQQRITKTGSTMRQRPESRRFSVLAVPYACLLSETGISCVTLGLVKDCFAVVAAGLVSRAGFSASTLGLEAASPCSVVLAL